MKNKTNIKNERGNKMDLRFNYDNIRRQIDNADWGYLDEKSLLVQDIKRDMNMQIDIILELEEQKIEIENKIKSRRLKLKEIAEKWDI